MLEALGSKPRAANNGVGRKEREEGMGKEDKKEGRRKERNKEKPGKEEKNGLLLL